MRLNSLGFLLREALSGLIRHRLMTLAAISTSAICFTIMGAFLASLCVLHVLTASFTSQLGISIFMKDSADRMDTLRARDKILALPGVSSASIVTKEAVYERMQRDMGHLPLDGIKQNPLSDEIHVQLRDVEHIAPVSAAAHRIDDVDDVVVMREIVRKVQATDRLLKRLGTGAAGLLLLSTILVIANVIRLTVFARRREIRIMQLVGATNGFIRLPFLLEGLIYGTLGGGIAAAAVFYGGESLIKFTHAQLPFLPLDASAVPAQTLALALTGTGAVIGFLGSAASVRRFLHA